VCLSLAVHLYRINGRFIPSNTIRRRIFPLLPPYYVYIPSLCYHLPFSPLYPSQDRRPHTRTARRRTLPIFPILCGTCRKYSRLRWMQQLWRWWSRSDTDCGCSIFLFLHCKILSFMGFHRLFTKVIFRISRIRVETKQELTHV